MTPTHNVHLHHARCPVVMHKSRLMMLFIAPQVPLNAEVAKSFGRGFTDKTIIKDADSGQLKLLNLSYTIVSNEAGAKVRLTVALWRAPTWFTWLLPSTTPSSTPTVLCTFRCSG